MSADRQAWAAQAPGADRIAGRAPEDLPPRRDGPWHAAGAAPAPAAAPEAPHLYDLNGLIHASAWPIPGATPAPAGASPEVRCLPGPLSPAPDDAPGVGDARILGPRDILLDAPGMRMRIRDGREVTLDAPGLPPDLTRLIIGYSAAAPLLLQRGGSPLHAAAATGPDGAVLLLGDSGAGKSTFAAMLERRGMRLIGDDLIAAAIGAEEGAPEGGAALHRSLRAAKLWRDSAAAAGLEAGNAPAGTPAPDRLEGLEKSVHAWDGDAAGLTFPAPLRAVVRLGWLHPADAAPELTRLSPMEALPLLVEATARRGLADRLGLTGALMGRAARIAGAVPAFRLDRPRNFAAAERALDLVAGLVRQGGAR